MNRREWICHFLKSTTAAAVVPTLFGQESAPPWKPQFLSEEQNTNLIALGESILPGSADAACNRVIDLILSIESAETRQAFTTALAAFNKQSPFSKLSPAQQHALLEDASSPQSRMHPQFQLIKEWIADTYWSSHQGLKELGSTGRMAWEKFNACEQRS